jgi:hypothetical protein
MLVLWGKNRSKEPVMARWKIEVPGTFAAGIAFLDLETVKVATGGYRMRNGENLAKRWSIALAGVARDGKIVLVDGEVDGEPDETAARNGLAAAIFGASEVVYGATREFDEMICKGRFTNARRAHEPEPFFPSVYGAERLSWRNVGVGKSGAERGEDCLSRDVPALLSGRTEDGWVKVMVHLLRDVADLVLEAGTPDVECAEWCRRVLVDFDFAFAAILG